MSGPVLNMLGALLAATALVVLGLRALAAAGRRMQQPATVDTDKQADETPGNTPAALVEPPADIDEWTTDLELWLRLHTDLNHIENTLRNGLDAALHQFMDDLGVDDAALVDRPGFPGVRELIGAP